MSLEHDLTMGTDAQARVLAQYRRLSNLMALIGQVAAQVQPLEDALWDLYQQTDLSTADGVWLEYLGALVGENREGANDTLYQQYIRGRIIANRSGGEIDRMLSIISTVLASVAVPALVEWFPAAFTIEIPDDSLLPFNDPQRLRMLRLLKLGRGAAIGQEVITQAYDHYGTFTFAPSAALLASTILGFADASGPVIGGHFRDAVRV